MEQCEECRGTGECQWAKGDCPYCKGRGTVDPDQAWLDARDAEFDDRWNARMNP